MQDTLQLGQDYFAYNLKKDFCIFQLTRHSNDEKEYFPEKSNLIIYFSFCLSNLFKNLTSQRGHGKLQKMQMVSSF